MNPRTPLISTCTIAAAIHATALITLAAHGIRTALNFTLPALGSLIAVWLVHHGTPTPAQHKETHRENTTEQLGET